MHSKQVHLSPTSNTIVGHTISTDFGGIYIQTPSSIERPTTIKQLATLLKQYNDSDVPVTIRNTGHSINGQTVTAGARIDIGDIKGITFDSQAMQVRAKAGNSWHEVLQAIDFPHYCLPLFPNNPHQEIKIGGTASVGGVGFYSSSAGGFWNHVISLQLVTMQGDIITCSHEQNADLFSYALAGFGRIGVIAEVTVQVVNSTRNVVPIALLHVLEDARLVADIDQLVADPVVSGVVISHGLTGIGFAQVSIPVVVALIETDSDNAQEIIHSFYAKHQERFCAYLHEVNTRTHMLGITRHPSVIAKHSMVYWYPHHAKTINHLAHPWSDFVVPKYAYQGFLSELIAMVKTYKLENYLTQEPGLFRGLDVFHIPSYALRQLDPQAHIKYPLALELLNTDSYSLTASLLLNVPNHAVEPTKKLVKEATDLMYNMGGKRYLYGLHSLTRRQILQHYGESTLEEWEKIKHRLDPKHLLNRGVIEHLEQGC